MLFSASSKIRFSIALLSLLLSLFLVFTCAVEYEEDKYEEDEE